MERVGHGRRMDGYRFERVYGLVHCMVRYGAYNYCLPLGFGFLHLESRFYI